MTKNSLRNLADITRVDFPILQDKIEGKYPLIYLDHAATSQKPKQVINVLNDYYFTKNSNVHRGAHQLSAKATESFENARKIIAQFINANNSNEIVFTRNATEAINLVARCWGESNLKEGDEILISLMEHHSNIVPWQLIAKKKGCSLKYVSLTNKGELDINDFKLKLTNKTRLVSLVHISNTLGCCNPIEEISDLAHKNGSLVLLDACQSLAHQEINIKSLNIDFLAGSSHKLCGPTGIGFLWSHESILSEMPPFLGGGEMIENVYLSHSTWAELPHKFEAGTPAIGEAIGLGEALQYLKKIGLINIKEWEKELTKHLFDGLLAVPDITILGPTPEENPNRGALATFHIKNIHSNDIAELLDNNGVCIRSGNHCCQPLHDFYNINSSARASLSFTTRKDEIDQFIDELKSTINFLKINS